jgi:hypothetical protein
MTTPFRPEDDQSQDTQPASVADLRARLTAAPTVQPTEGAEPTQDGEPTEGGGIFSFKDTILALGRGPIKAVNETVNTVNSVVTWAAQQYSKRVPRGLRDDSLIRFLGRDTDALNIPVGDSQTVIGGMVEGVTQFAVGLVGTGKIIGTARAAGRAAQFANLTLRGAIVDAGMFDPYEDTLAEIADEIGPEFTQSLASFLASDEDDNEAERRFKNAVEGAALGGALDVLLFFGARAIRGIRRLKAKPEGPAADAAEAQVKKDLGELQKATKEQDADVADAQIELFPNKSDAIAYNASIRQAERLAELPKGSLTDEQITEVKRVADEIGDIEDVAQLDDIVRRSDFNFNYVQSAQEARRVILAISETLGQKLPTRDVVQTNEVTRALGGEMFRGVSAEEAEQMIRTAFGATEQLPQIITGARMYMHSLGNKISRLARRVDLSPDDPAAVDQLAASIDHLYRVADDLTGTQANSGRALQAQQITASAADLRPRAGGVIPAERVIDSARQSITGMTKTEIRQLGRMLRMVDGDPSQIIGLTAAHTNRAVAKATGDSTVMDKVIEVALNGMLSSPKTHVINVGTTAVASALRPAETMLAGTISRNPTLRQEGWDTLTGLFLSMGDSWNAARKAFRLGRNVLDPEVMIDDRAIAQSGAWGGPLGKLINLPSRFLLTGDEWLKQMNYRANVRAQSLRLSAADGVVDPDQIARRLQEDMEFAFSPDGSARNARAREFAREATFTSDLEYGFGRSMQNLAKDHPVIRLAALPFVRTPVNLFRFAWQRTPILGLAQRQMREAIAAGGERAAEAMARQATGAMIWGTGAILAHNRMITGRGPSNPKLRELWLQNHQPYSIKVGDRWISYRRADPILSPLGLVADMYTMFGEMEAKGESGTKVAYMFGAAFASNLTSKTFFQGASDLLGAMSSGHWSEVQRYVAQRGAALVPFSAAGRSIGNVVDPVWREVEGVVENVASTIPGYSRTLPPSRNIFGEPILRPPGVINRAMNPFTISKPFDDSVVDELVSLGRGMGMPLETRGDQDLTDVDKWDNGSGQAPYDRMLELLSTRGGSMPDRTLREMVEQTIRSPEYQEASPGTAAYPGGLRFDMVNRLVQTYQRMAEQAMLAEYPALANAIQLEEQRSLGAKLAGEQGVREAELLNRTNR